MITLLPRRNTNRTRAVPRPAISRIHAYSPDQERDDHGRFGSGGDTLRLPEGMDYETALGMRLPDTWKPDHWRTQAYGGVLVNSKGEFLLREPTNHFGGYSWTFPKGKMDSKDEHPVDTALAEVREETGYQGRIVEALPQNFPSQGSNSNFFIMRVESHDPEHMDKETSATRWVSYDEAHRLIETSQNWVGRYRDSHILNSARIALKKYDPHKIMASARKRLMSAGGPGSGCHGPNCGRPAGNVAQVMQQHGWKKLGPSQHMLGHKPQKTHLWEHPKFGAIHTSLRHFAHQPIQNPANFNEHVEKVGAYWAAPKGTPAAENLATKLHNYLEKVQAPAVDPVKKAAEDTAAVVKTMMTPKELDGVHPDNYWKTPQSKMDGMPTTAIGNSGHTWQYNEKTGFYHVVDSLGNMKNPTGDPELGSTRDVKYVADHMAEYTPVTGTNDNATPYQPKAKDELPKWADGTTMAKAYIGPSSGKIYTYNPASGKYVSPDGIKYAPTDVGHMDPVTRATNTTAPTLPSGGPAWASHSVPEGMHQQYGDPGEPAHSSAKLVWDPVDGAYKQDKNGSVIPTNAVKAMLDGGKLWDPETGQIHEATKTPGEQLQEQEKAGPQHGDVVKFNQTGNQYKYDAAIGKYMPFKHVQGKMAKFGIQTPKPSSIAYLPTKPLPANMQEKYMSKGHVYAYDPVHGMYGKVLKNGTVSESGQKTPAFAKWNMSPVVKTDTVTKPGYVPYSAPSPKIAAPVGPPPTPPAYKGSGSGNVYLYDKASNTYKAAPGTKNAAPDFTPAEAQKMSHMTPHDPSKDVVEPSQTKIADTSSKPAPMTADKVPAPDKATLANTHVASTLLGNKLQYVQSATHMGGAFEKYLFKDNTDGKQYMFKPAQNLNGAVDPKKAYIDQAVSQIQAIVRPGFSVPAAAVHLTVPGKGVDVLGSAQQVVPTEYLRGKDAQFKDFTGRNFGTHPLQPFETAALQQEHVLDWLISNHDAHAGQFLRTSSQYPGGRGVIGVDKCLGKDTPILMYDGSIKMVQEVLAGDQVMGPDSKPRNVLSTCSGVSPLYKVTPVKGDSYIVNHVHILSLKKYDRCTWVRSVVNVNVQDWLRSKSKGLHKGWRTGVTFAETSVPIDPYFFGLWLGDGDSDGTSITTMDKPVVDVIYATAKAWNLEVRVRTNHAVLGKCRTYAIVSSMAMSNGRSGGSNGLLTAFHSLGLAASRKKGIIAKHIPKQYLVNSEDVRLKVLAGLVDSDGHCQNNTFIIPTKFDGLAKDIMFLARSLGLAAYNHRGFNKKYQRWYNSIAISGDTHRVPVKLDRKRATVRLQKKDALATGIKVTPAGKGDYFGFELDGDCLFLLGDFTVTHNTQSFRFFPSDTLSTTYWPNKGEKEPLYNEMWREVKDGKASFDPDITDQAIKRAESIPDDKYVAMLKPYVDSRFNSADEGAKFLAQALDRKHNLRSDFEGVISEALGHAFKFGQAPVGEGVVSVKEHAGLTPPLFKQSVNPIDIADLHASVAEWADKYGGGSKGLINSPAAEAGKLHAANNLYTQMLQKYGVDQSAMTNVWAHFQSWGGSASSTGALKVKTMAQEIVSGKCCSSQEAKALQIEHAITRAKLLGQHPDGYVKLNRAVAGGLGTQLKAASKKYDVVTVQLQNAEGWSDKPGMWSGTARITTDVSVDHIMSSYPTNHHAWGSHPNEREYAVAFPGIWDHTAAGDKSVGVWKAFKSSEIS